MHLYSTRLGKAANALGKLQMEQECLKSVSERRQRDVWCMKFSRKTVPHPRSLDSKAAVAVVCSCVWNSQLAGVSGSKTPAGDCWCRLAIHLKVLWSHAVQTLAECNLQVKLWPTTECFRGFHVTLPLPLQYRARCHCPSSWWMGSNGKFINNVRRLNKISWRNSSTQASQRRLPLTGVNLLTTNTPRVVTW